MIRTKDKPVEYVYFKKFCKIHQNTEPNYTIDDRYP